MVQTLHKIMKRRGVYYTVMDDAGHWGTYCNLCHEVDFSDSGKGTNGLCPKHGLSVSHTESFSDKFHNLLHSLNLGMHTQYIFMTSNCTICQNSKSLENMDLEEISSIFDEPKRNFSHIKNPQERVKAWLRAN